MKKSGFLILLIFGTLNLWTIDYKTKYDSLKTVLENKQQAEKYKHQFKAFLQKDGYPRINLIECEDEAGYIWMQGYDSNDNKTFYRFDGIEFENMQDRFLKTCKDTLTWMESTENGTAYFKSKKGAARWNGKSFDYHHFPENDTLKYMQKFNDKIYFIGNKGIGKFEDNKFNYRKIDKFNTYKNTTKYNLITKIRFIDSQENIWFTGSVIDTTKEESESDQNLYRIHNGKINKVYDLKENESAIQIIEDENSTVYINFKKRLGVYQDSLKFYQKSDSFPLEDISEIELDGKNNLWCFGFTHKKDDNLVFFQFNNNEKLSLFSTIVAWRNLFFFSDNIVYQNSYFIIIKNGYYNYKTSSFVDDIIVFNINKQEFIDIQDIKFDTVKHINKQSFVCISAQNDLKIYKNFKLKKTINIPFADQFVRIFISNDSEYLIGGSEYGFYKFIDYDYDKITIKDGLSSNKIKKIHKVKDGFLLSNSENKKIDILRFTSQIETKRLDNKELNFLWEDNYDNYWFMNKDKKEFLLFSKDLNKILKKFSGKDCVKDNLNKEVWILDKKQIYSVENMKIKDRVQLPDSIRCVDIRKTGSHFLILPGKLPENEKIVSILFDKRRNDFSVFPDFFFDQGFEDNNKLYLSIFNPSLGYLDMFTVRSLNVDDLTKFNKENISYLNQILYNSDKKYNKIFCLASGRNIFSSIMKGKQRNYYIEDGLPGGNFISEAEDTNGNLWFAFEGGLAKYLPEYDRFVSYIPEDGIPTDINDIESDRKGGLWLATDQGLVKFHEPEFKANPVISHLEVDTLRFYPDEKIKLPFKHNSPEIKYKAVTMKFPEKIKYSVFLEGFSDDWSEYTFSRNKQYEQLPPGKYNFQYKAMLKNGKILDGPSLNFQILPPWYQTWWFYSILIIIVATILYFIYKIRVKVLEQNQEKLEKEVENRTHQLSEAYTTIEEEKTKLTDSIQYASLIQNSILPREAELSQYIKDFFIIWKPRDIVGGDFYWFYPIPHNVTPSKVEEVNNTKEYLISVIDCTGHGVPGAFMSMTANSILNNIVREKQIYEPDKILNLLHKEIRYTLRQQAKESQQDGMDISLCLIKPKEIHFAGAMQSAYFVRGDRSGEIGDREIRRIRGDRFSIGGKQKEAERIFRKQIIKYNPGDKIYLMSDGLADQKVKIDGKEQRFKTKRVQKLLSEISDLPMKEQKEKIQNKLKELQGDFEQRDDLTVMGIALKYFN